jgi:hypothetical protein
MANTNSITLAQAQEHLANWMQAETAVAQGQEYSIGGRDLKRVDAKTITEKIKFWDNYCSKLQNGRNGGLRVMRVMPLDI